MESFFENKLSIIDLFKITNKKRNEEKITRYKKKIIYKKIDKKENKEVIEKENKPKFNKRKAINQVVNSIMK